MVEDYKTGKKAIWCDGCGLYCNKMGRTGWYKVFKNGLVICDRCLSGFIEWKDSEECVEIYLGQKRVNDVIKNKKFCNVV